MAATGTVWEASRPEIPVSMATEYVCTRYQLHFTLISYCLKKKIGIGSRQILPLFYFNGQNNISVYMNTSRQFV